MTNPIRRDPAAALLPGDVITTHPDHPDIDGEWTITNVRRLPGLRARLDYRTGDKTGCFVIPQTQTVTYRRDRGYAWLTELTHDEAEQMLAFLAGWTRDGVAEALADAQRSRDARSRAAERVEEANAA